MRLLGTPADVLFIKTSKQHNGCLIKDFKESDDDKRGLDFH
jgi:hypothetical protein